MCKLLLVVTLVCVVAAGFVQSEASSEPVTATAGGTPTFTNVADAERAALSALAGDGRDAWSIRMYLVNLPGHERDTSAEHVALIRHWEEIAIENGSRSALLTVGYRLLDSSNPCELRRGLYLVSRGIKDGLDSPPPAGQRNWNAELATATARLKALPPARCLLGYSPAAPKARRTG